MFILGKILAALILPPGLFAFLFLLCVLLAAKGRKKAAITTASLASLLVYALSTGFAASALVRPLENAYAPLGSFPADARAVLALGGGYNDNSPEYGGEGTLTRASVKRAVYALELARRFDLPLVFSGGKGLDTSLAGSEAEAAGRLWASLGMERDRIKLEKESVDTKENAFHAVRLAGEGPYILVTSAFHMPRAMLSFERTGARVYAAPTDYRARRSRTSWADFLPDTGALDTSRLALHEYIGLLYYRMTL
jgi:uncharacterized SAM-binding protein YcdF (DUF218 family)